MIYELKAKSSSGDGHYYDVVINDENGELKITCNCMAGMTGTMCKHRIAVITGEYKQIISPQKKENAKLREATSFLADRGLRDKYIALITELDELKRKFKMEERAIKDKINKLLVS